MADIQPAVFGSPVVGEFTSAAALRADDEQQQQQQQQQQGNHTVRRFIDAATQLPHEEVVSKLTTEVRQLNSVGKKS